MIRICENSTGWGKEILIIAKHTQNPYFLLPPRGNDFTKAEFWSLIQAGNSIFPDSSALCPSSLVQEEKKKKQSQLDAHNGEAREGSQREGEVRERCLRSTACDKAQLKAESSSKDSTMLPSHTVSNITVDYIRKSSKTFLWEVIYGKALSQDEKWNLEDSGTDNHSKN